MTSFDDLFSDIFSRYFISLVLKHFVFRCYTYLFGILPLYIIVLPLGVSVLVFYRLYFTFVCFVMESTQGVGSTSQTESDGRTGSSGRAGCPALAHNLEASLSTGALTQLTRKQPIHELAAKTARQPSLTAEPRGTNTAA